MPSRLSDHPLARRAARSVLLLGDGIRPIVQKPIVRDFIGTTRVGRALDAGCGRGLYTQVLKQVADEVDAIDFDPGHVEAQTRRLAPPDRGRVRLRVGSVDDLPYEDKSFDLAVHCEVLEHVEDDAKVLSELARVVKHGGRLIISVPVPPAPYDDENHVREGYEPDQLFAMLREAGFEVLRHEFCMFAHTKRVMRWQVGWTRRLGRRVPPPAVMLLPVWWERFTARGRGREATPYDIVVEARRGH